MTQKKPGALAELQIAYVALQLQLDEQRAERDAALTREVALAEVLAVINGSPDDPGPVFDAILEKAQRICHADAGALMPYDGDHCRAAATRGLPSEFVTRLSRPFLGRSHERLINDKRIVHVADAKTIPWGDLGEVERAFLEHTELRTLLLVPLRKCGRLLGVLSAVRHEVRPFSDREIAFLEGLAAQAVIAMENARLVTERREALEQQTATTEVLRVINASPGRLTPVFEAVIERATRLCNPAIGLVLTWDGDRYHRVAWWGASAEDQSEANRAPVITPPGSPGHRLARGETVVCIPDLAIDEGTRHAPSIQAMVRFGARSYIAVALRKDDRLLGAIIIYRKEVQPFTHQEIALLQNFAAQAVIAMENARLLHELRARTDELAQRQSELRVTFENMGDGVAMFDATPRLVAWNRKFQEIFDVPDALLDEHRTYTDYIRYLAARGDYGPGIDSEEQIRRITASGGEYHTYERTRPDGRVIEVRRNPVAAGGFVLIFADITERKRSEAELRAAHDAAQEASRTIEAAYQELKAAQANLIQAEKMASLGQLTAGIAHEIKNPLNFVNNFASLSVELLDELKATAAPGFAALDEGRRTDIEDVTGLLTSNLEKIVEHGRRADGIVKSMLEHSRGASGERKTVDINTLVNEALNLAYHGARAQDQSFKITLERDFESGIAPIELNPQDMTRVCLNLFSNGFYAARKRQMVEGEAFKAGLKVTTRDLDDVVEVKVRDNGTGIPADILDKLFQPFFTTKPTGEGTGLGLSITYDIVTKQHGGTILVQSEEGAYTEFTITIPHIAAAALA